MNEAATSVSPATSTDLRAILVLLTSAGLPVADLTPDSPTEFLVARHASRVVGVVGLERFGEVGLLRSLAVSAEHQRQGLGRALTRALEERAALTGIDSLVLLTETARNFFQRYGYEVIARTAAPASVQASSEFRTLCPESAVCMRKHL